MQPRQEASKQRGLLPYRLVLALILVAAAGTGCSRQKLVVSMTSSIIEASLEEIYSSGDVETARKGLPGQILFLRGLCRSDPDRLDVWTATVQLYAAYPMLFVDDEDPPYAARLYAEGKDLGLRFLRRERWFEEAWLAGPDTLRAVLTRRAPVKLAPILMWTSACLGKHVLYNQDRPREMLDLPYVHVMLDAAVEMAPEYFHGMPLVVKGIIMAMIPLGLGGNLEEADRYFQKAFEISGGRFLLQQVFYAKHVCVTSLDEQRFVEMLEAVLASPEDLLPEVRFVNTLARQRAAELLEMREDLF